MTVLIDTNVVLDVLLGRRPFAASSARVFDLADAGRIRGVLGATTVTTVFYLAEKGRGLPTARALTRDLLSIFGVAAVDDAVLRSALELSSPDYEDAVLHEAGVRAGAHAIATRDGVGFAGLALPAFTPDELLAWVASG
jgi:predicted nucleic acid-binding protein